MKIKGLLKKWAAVFTGDDMVLTRELSVMHSAGGLSDAVSDYRKGILRKYLALFLAVLAAALLAAGFTAYTRMSVQELKRPDPGEADRSVPVRIEAEYDGEEVTREYRLHVASKLRTEEEKDRLLKAFADMLPDRVAAETDGRRLVTGDLNLPERDEDTGIEIRWSSAEPEILSADGRVDVTGMDADSRQVELTADLRLDDRYLQTAFSVLVVNHASLYTVSIDRELEDLVNHISESTEGDRIILPEKTGGGVRLHWETGAPSAVPLILLLGAAGIFFIFNSRYEKARKQSRAYRDAVIMEFPNVVDKLVLLLNSGLTVFSALMRLSGEKDPKNGKLSPMASELYMIGQRVKETNASAIEEWKAFAARMESADILRFCAILEDNLSKGSELSLKLENESENFMDMRRKQTQQHIRMIDSRMIIPMMAMLMSLILVTISPVITGF